MGLTVGWAIQIRRTDEVFQLADLSHLEVHLHLNYLPKVCSVNSEEAIAKEFTAYAVPTATVEPIENL